jgi:hypothetical protein
MQGLTPEQQFDVPETELTLPASSDIVKPAANSPGPIHSAVKGRSSKPGTATKGNAISGTFL